MTSWTLAFLCSEALSIPFVHRVLFPSWLDAGVGFTAAPQLQLLEWLLPCMCHHSLAGTPWPSPYTCWFEAQDGCSWGLQPCLMLGGESDSSQCPISSHSHHFYLTWLSFPYSPFQPQCTHTDVSHPWLSLGWSGTQKGKNAFVATQERRHRVWDNRLHRTAVTEWIFKGEEIIKTQLPRPIGPGL